MRLSIFSHKSSHNVKIIMIPANITVIHSIVLKERVYSWSEILLMIRLSTARQLWDLTLAQAKKRVAKMRLTHTKNDSGQIIKSFDCVEYKIS